MAIIRSVVCGILQQSQLTSGTSTSLRFFHASTFYFNNNSLRRLKEKMATRSKNVQPPWSVPEGTEVPKLKLYNSLTRQKLFCKGTT